MPPFSFNSLRTNLTFKSKKCKENLALLAGATGFEPAISALTGPHVEPLHHAPERKISYHIGNQKSRDFLESRIIK